MESRCDSAAASFRLCSVDFFYIIVRDERVAYGWRRTARALRALNRAKRSVLEFFAVSLSLLIAGVSSTLSLTCSSSADTVASGAPISTCSAMGLD